MEKSEAPLRCRVVAVGSPRGSTCDPLHAPGAQRKKPFGDVPEAPAASNSDLRRSISAALASRCTQVATRYGYTCSRSPVTYPPANVMTPHENERG